VGWVERWHFDALEICEYPGDGIELMIFMRNDLLLIRYN
jgi:hypothetical protein